MDRTAREQDFAGARVAPLGQLNDLEVADGFPDPRGWDVVTTDGTEVGKVHELIVDTGTLRTRYLDVAIKSDYRRERANDADVLVPVGAARLDGKKDRVVLDGISASQLAQLPGYTHGPITRDYEAVVVSAFPARRDTGAAGQDFYDQAQFDDRQFAARSTTADQASDDRSTMLRRRAASDRTATATAGGGAGATTGTAAGAAGAAGGPLGMLLGGVAGALGGWWAGKEVHDASSQFRNRDDYFHGRYDAEHAPRPGWRTYEDARPLYQLGYLASQNPDYRGKSFEEIEPELRRGWTAEDEQRWGSWTTAREAIRSGYTGQGR